MSFQRSYLEVVKQRIDLPRKFIQALTGPRQVGKTTIVRQLIDQITIPYIYESADNVPASSDIWIEQLWEAARLKLKTENANELLLVVDEIQKVKNWSDAVKKEWDFDSFNQLNIKVVLLGSSGLLLQQGLNESLAGRFELIKIPHWSYNEMHECFGFSAEQYAWFGGYPGSAFLVEDEKRWKEYVRNALIEATISKDILMLTFIKKPALFQQVFEMGVLYSSKILSYSKMVGQLQDAGNTTTISHYMRLLDVAGLLLGLPKFYSEKYRTKASIPKWQIKNSALFSALSPKDFSEIQSDFIAWGQVIESAIGAHLINMADEGNYKVYYWRHRNDEVDFVLQKGEKIIGIEVKSGQEKSTKGMISFKEKYNPAAIFLIGKSGILWQDFLKINPAILFD